MVKKVTLSLLILLFGGSFLFWAQPLAFAAPNPQSPTPPPAAEEEASIAAEPTIADLLSRVEALETQVTALHEEIAASQPAVTSLAQAFRVTTAVYLLDNAGLHDLDVRLNEEGEILPADAGKVARVGRLLSAVDWPTPLAENAETLTGLITDLSAALSDDDVTAAAPLATEVHDVGHDLSHDAEHWLGEGMAAIAQDGHDEAAQAFRVTTAVYLLDNAGLHDLDVRLNEEGEILPADAGKVARVGRLLSAVDWPTPLAENAETLTGLITDLSAALSDDDVTAAAPLATEVHDVGHDLSHDAEHWLQEAHEGNSASQHGEDAATEDAANGEATSEEAPTDDDNANSDSSDGG